MKRYYSYLVISVAASLLAPQAFAENMQKESEQLEVATEKIEPKSELSSDAQESTNTEKETQVLTEVENDSLNPVEDISSFYSDIDMRMRLAVKANAKPCSIETCAENQAFDARVQLIGESLAKSAYALYPELKKQHLNSTLKWLIKKCWGLPQTQAAKSFCLGPFNN